MFVCVAGLGCALCLHVLALGIIWCVVQMSEPLVLLIAVPYHA